MSTIKETIAQLFGKAKENGTVEQVSAQAVVTAQEVDTTDESKDAVPASPVADAPEETPADSTDAVPEAPTETPAEPAATAAASITPTGGQGATATLEVSALAELQRKATAYDSIHAEHAQLKAWHTAAQGGIGLGPDANMATETKPKHLSAATKQAQEIAKARGLVVS